MGERVKKNGAQGWPSDVQGSSMWQEKGGLLPAGVAIMVEERCSNNPS